MAVQASVTGDDMRASSTGVAHAGGGRIELTELSKWYGDQQVLRSIDLAIEAGEFFSLLGPSGCGKTTTLRLIGGFEQADDGIVRIDGADMRDVPPERRPGGGGSASPRRDSGESNNSPARRAQNPAQPHAP